MTSRITRAKAYGKLIHVVLQSEKMMLHRLVDVTLNCFHYSTPLCSSKDSLVSPGVVNNKSHQIYQISQSILGPVTGGTPFK